MNSCAINPRRWEPGTYRMHPFSTVASSIAHQQVISASAGAT